MAQPPEFNPPQSGVRFSKTENQHESHKNAALERGADFMLEDRLRESDESRKKQNDYG
jgi:hypothetical protein